MSETATVLVDGEQITGTIYNTRDNGWPCVETDTGRVASGPEVLHITNDSVPPYVGATAAKNANWQRVVHIPGCWQLLTA